MFFHPEEDLANISNYSGYIMNFNKYTLKWRYWDTKHHRKIKVIGSAYIQNNQYNTPKPFSNQVRPDTSLRQNNVLLLITNHI